MTQQHESLSAVVDGEAKDEALLNALTRDVDLADKWQRYHLIRQGLRKEMPANANFDISKHVAEALENEPAILAPKRNWRDLPVIGAVVPLVRQGGQLAIAASVAVAVVIGVQQYNQPAVDSPVNNTPLTLPGIKGGLSPVSLEETRAIPRTDIMEQRRLMNAYLTDHRHQLRIKSSSNVNAQGTNESPDQQIDAVKDAAEKTSLPD